MKQFFYDSIQCYEKLRRQRTLAKSQLRLHSDEHNRWSTRKKYENSSEQKCVVIILIEIYLDDWSWQLCLTVFRFNGWLTRFFCKENCFEVIFINCHRFFPIDFLAFKVKWRENAEHNWKELIWRRWNYETITDRVKQRTKSSKSELKSNLLHHNLAWN